MTRFECPRCQTTFDKDIGADEAFVECPTCGALALPSHAETQTHLDQMVSIPTQIHPSPRDAAGQTEIDVGDKQERGPFSASQPSASAPRVGAFPGIFADMLGDASQGQPAQGPVDDPTAVVTRKNSTEELNFNFSNDLSDADFPQLPVTAPGALSLPKRLAEAAALERTKSASGITAPPPDDGFDDENRVPTDVRRVPWSAFSDEAFGELEKAFDQIAEPPSPTSPAAVRLERVLTAQYQVRPPPLRKGDDDVERAEPPPLPRAVRKPPARAKSTILELSAEARDLAFLPLEARRDPSTAPRAAGEARPAMAAKSSSSPSLGKAPARKKTQDNLRGAELPADEISQRPPVPSAWSGITFLRAAAMVLLFCAVGVGVGYVATPKVQRTSTARGLAELKLANGNRAYFADPPRYDDALNEYTAAISSDRTCAAPYKAKGAALAKLRRHDAAAEAYKAYLNLEPGALDADDIKAALKARGLGE